MPSVKPLPKREALEQYFSYDAETGKVTRCKATGGAKVGAEIKYQQAGYLIAGFKSKIYPLHRLIWMMHHGEDPGELQIDHINGDTLDNRISNLRAVDNSGNSKNRALSQDSVSGHPGVSMCRRAQKWVAYIGGRGVRKHLGYFESKEDAIAARKAAESDRGYHENHGRTAHA